MNWTAEAIIADFTIVARLAGVELAAGQIAIEDLPAPHLPPTKLPAGKMAVYVFYSEGVVLKVGKVGAKSQARYTSQHYNPGSAMSTLASSVLADQARHGIIESDAGHIGSWIKRNVSRVNFLVDQDLGIRLLSLLETFLHCRLKPIYEGFKGQI